ncbi:serine hydrolase [Brevibacterium sp. 5221]|uniref:Serine hydrolase n=1 Tax=Brevibacterium rongguiense TaxID=2695267 RepID=A0A6N9H5K0_9MICO|nr:serine hydrolase domain-containing protein [Brevibacterium rongguiense]MYM19348.1 serine hydrolase [Brevibacterium rongguiense]
MSTPAAQPQPPGPPQGPAPLERPAPPPRLRALLRSRRGMLAAALALALVAACALAFPWPRGFRGAPAGDESLARSVQAALPAGYRHSGAFALVKDGSSPRFGGFGADEHTVFEIGSVTKTFTAALFADAVRRGEVRAAQRLGSIFPELRDAPAGELTLEQLAEQQTGFPRRADAAPLGQLPRTLARLDPCTKDLAGVLAHAARTEPDPGHYAYSNLGVALLGQAVARAAHTDYPALVRARLLEPLGMTETTVPMRPADLPAGSPHGYTAAGLPAGPWTLGALAPAGSIRSTAHDMALWVAAMADGTAPGAAAAKERADADDGAKIGYVWMHTDGLTWHNGATGGYRSWAGFDAHGRGLVVLTDSAVSVDEAADALREEGADS